MWTLVKVQYFFLSEDIREESVKAPKENQLNSAYDEKSH